MTPLVHPGNVDGWTHLTGNVDTSDMPADASPPRLFSPPHPEAVGTYATVLIPLIQARMASEGQSLRWWQVLVLTRALEHDVDGRLCWDRVVVTVGRQQGKSLLAKEIALARCAHPQVFAPEPQTVVMLSRVMTAATLIHSQAWPWAKDQGLGLLRRFGSESITWADGSAWQVSALSAVYGRTASMVLVDEGWDVPPRVFTAGVLPTLASRHNSQAWLLSTANDDATDLIPAARVEAARPGSRTMLAEWSAPDDADPADLASYRLASPHWDPQRERLIQSVIGTDDAVSQFLNRWPARHGGAVKGWPVGWADAARVTGSPPRGAGVGALEIDLAHESFGVALAVADGARVDLWTRVCPSLDAAVATLLAWAPGLVFAGVSIADQAARYGGPWVLERAGSQESRVASPALQAAVRDGRLAHDHDADTIAQTEAAVAVMTEHGEMLSGRRSKGAVAALKAASWALQGCLDAALPDAARVF